MSDTEKTIGDEILERANLDTLDTVVAEGYEIAGITLQYLIENSKGDELRFLESALRGLRAAKRESGK